MRKSFATKVLLVLLSVIVLTGCGSKKIKVSINKPTTQEITTASTTITTTTVRTTTAIPTTTTTVETTIATTTTKATTTAKVIQQEAMVWIPKSGKKYHSRAGCSNMKNPSQVTKSKAINLGYEPCKKCY